jgi:hypothetical protein
MVKLNPVKQKKQGLGAPVFLLYAQPRAEKVCRKTCSVWFHYTEHPDDPLKAEILPDGSITAPQEICRIASS